MTKPKIAVSVSDNLTVRDVRKAQKLADIAELRVDLFSSKNPAHVLAFIRRLGPIAKIATIRSRKEGGRWAGSEAARLKLFRALMPRVQMVDIELSSQRILKQVIRMAHRRRKRAVVSYHDFKRTPLNLEPILRQAQSAGADIVKIATLAKSAKDVERLGAFLLRHRKKRLVVIAMGPKGRRSRLLFPRQGSLWAYASLGQKTAPGQWELARMRQMLLRFDKK